MNESETKPEELDALRKQVSDQCRVVAHLAKAIHDLHSDYADIVLAYEKDSMLEMVGKRTAAWMEELGDMLNAVDAVTEEDEWTTPIFHEAHRRWPVRP
jgi:hypothetical protein